MPNQEEEQRLIILNAIGLTLSAKRAESVAARAQSGIENDWIQDEEFYQGYDDANRHEFVNSVSKPTADGQVREPEGVSSGSTVFPNITQPYVDAVSARVGDMLLPTDDRNFAIDAVTDNNRAPLNAESPQIDEAEKATKAEDQIDDWLQECQYHGEVRAVIDDAAKLGSGVIKGPVPVKRKSTSWTAGDDGSAKMVVIEAIVPASFRIDPWNLFPDGACGESIHNGAFIFERDYMTTKRLENLKGVPGYIDSQIDKCLDEGPGNRKESNERANVTSTKDQFEIWYAHISITSDELLACGCEVDDGQRSYPALMTMVNNHVIRAALNPLDSGEFPYDVIPWKRRPGMPWGMGLGRQLRTPQRIVVGATRELMNNLGIASGPQLVIRRGVKPENGVWDITPRKLWIEEDDAAGSTGSPVIAVVIPTMQAELKATIDLGMKMAEDVTGMPMLMQGQQGMAPDTVGGMTILNNNANSVLRRVARLFDSSITEPHIRRYYAWLMAYGDDEAMKGEFKVVARGSAALVERDIQSQEMVNILQLCLNPAYGKNPKRAMDEYLKSRRYDTAAFDYTEEELAQMQQQPPQADPRKEAAEIMAKSRTDVATIAAETRKTEIVTDAQLRMKDIEVSDANLDADRALRDKEINGKLIGEIERLKSNLAEVQMKLKIQVEEGRLNRAQSDDHAVAGHAMAMRAEKPMIAPAVEPSGRAPDGQSFTR